MDTKAFYTLTAHNGGKRQVFHITAGGRCIDRSVRISWGLLLVCLFCFCFCFFRPLFHPPNNILPYVRCNFIQCPNRPISSLGTCLNRKFMFIT